ncbi:DUF4214 domain-containing protein [Massilia sp.]|uniref:DUF4214 domain-containing protein n=1 Tax=Massilia sp. TaxID=1882437 RepID=UPI0039198322
MAIVNAHVEAVQKLYVAYFNRPADTAGLDYWTNVVQAQNGSTAAVSAAFAAEAEYKTEYANMSNADVVNKVYLNLFGRAAEDAGKAYWANLLDTKAITIDKVVAAIASGAQSTDARAYANKVIGATAFTNALDTKLEQDGYKGAAANTAAKTFMSSITTDATLQTATAPAALATSVAKVVAAGTPFTLTSGLATLQAATAAKTSFLAAADGDDDAKTSTDDTAIDTAVTTAAAAVDAKVAGDYANATAGVRAALLADQQAANAAAVTAAQTKVAAANTKIAEVAGLSAAVATETAAKTAASNAAKAVTNAAADLAAKVASLDVLNTTATKAVAVSVNDTNGEVTIETTVTNADATTTVTTKKVIELVDGKLALASGVTEANTPGVTALLASTTAKEAADTAATKANAASAAATLNVNYLDMTAAEITALSNIKAKMTDVTVGENALPTWAQITTQKSILEAEVKAGTTTQAVLDEFNGLITTYEGIDQVNTRVAELTAATNELTAANKAITDLAKLVSDMQKAVAVQDQKAALNATIAAAEKAFTDNKMTLPMEASGSMLATGASDIFLAGDADASISLFGLIGTDSLYIGNQYTLNTGKLTAGNNAVLEAFIIANATGGTDIVLETSAFGSNASTPEVITITLTGVASTDVVLNNGIITVSTPTV